MTRWVAGLTAVTLACIGSTQVWTPAHAADLPSSPPASNFYAPTPSSGWTVTLGAEARMLPKYEGADNYMLWPFPIVRIRRAGTPESFHSPRDGASFAILDIGPIKFGPTGKVRFDRKESRDSDLTGLGDIDWTLELGAFAEYWPTQWLRTRLEVRQGFGGHHGIVSDLTADVVVPVTPQLTFSAGPRLTAATDAATSPYFSITPAQSLASGLPVYDAGGGIRSYGAGVQLGYAWTPQWGSTVFAEYERLAGDAADSPLVTQRGSRDQIQVGIGVTYSFDVRGLW